MSRINYHYEPPESLNIVYEPGEICDFCGELNKIGRAGELILMPCDAAHEEYGHSEGDIHAHLSCAEAARDEYKRLYEESATAIENYLEPKRGLV